MVSAARFVSFWTGFVSLSLEIAWVRLYGYANSSTPFAFSFVLTVYLLGIAIGAQMGKRICRVGRDIAVGYWGLVFLLIASVVAVIAPRLYLESRQMAFDELIAPLGIFLTAATLAVLFPITHHLGTPRTDAVNLGGHKGRHFSRVYMLNVVGAALGPLVTGYVLLDQFTIDQIFPILGSVIFAVAVVTYFLFFGWQIEKTLLGLLPLALMLPTLLFLIDAGLASRSDPHRYVRALTVAGDRVVHTVHESRYGVIALARETVRQTDGTSFDDNVVYGGNVYDGKVNVDLERNTNGLHRPLVMHALQPNAKRALVLGLSIGSWLTVLEGFPGLESIDVVEINPGYLTLAKQFGPQSRALQDPRVKIHVDDARRWLRFNPDQRYDIILMNTTWHWRANSSMLLSTEMLETVKRHLAPDGVATFNATGSLDVFFTASKVFSHVRRYENFIYVAEWDCFSKMKEHGPWLALTAVRVDGSPGLSAESTRLTEFAKKPFVQIEDDIRRANRPPELVTDDNMLVEYRYGKR